MNGHDVGYFRILQTGHQRVLIGADIAPPYQGRRIASEAYPKFVQQILIPSGITELELRVLKKNEVGIKLYKNLGFVVDEETSSDYHMVMSIHKNNS
jgi:RimJ/RimL family protein N-acetyltransferase